MKNTGKILLICLFFAISGFAQTVDNEQQRAIGEITKLRQQVIEAIKKRDRQTLEKLFAEDFTHTHAIGKIDDKKTRLDVFVSGDKTIDTAIAEDLKIRVFGDKTAVASGKSSVRSDDGTMVAYRWIVVYAKIGKKWQVVASQATKLA